MNTTQKIIKIFAIALAFFIIATILKFSLIIISSISGFNILSNSNVINFEQEYKDVSSIEIDSIITNISIKNGDKFKVVANNVGETFKAELINNNLIIKEDKKIIFKRYNNAEIIIYVPDITLNELKLDSGSGKIIIEHLNLNKLEIDQGAGILEISNSNLNNVKIDGGAGEINIKTSNIHNLKLDAGVGKINIDSSLTGINDINCGVGELRLQLKDKEKYSLNITKGIGNIEVDGNNQRSDYKFGSGNNVVNISGGVGSIIVNFN